MSSYKTQPPKAFWIISAIALVWNLLGVMAYVMQVTMSPEALAALPEAEHALYDATPAWATGAFAVAVFAGALGCLALLLRKSWAVPLFVASLLGVLVQMTHSLFFSSAMDVYGPKTMIMPAMIVVIGVFMIYYSRRAKNFGWLT